MIQVIETALVKQFVSMDRPPAIFISGSLGLDFLNTLATPVDTQVDWIDDGIGLLCWLEQARLVPAKTLKALKARAMPGEFDAVAAQARNLREWFRGFVRARSGKKLGVEDLHELEPLNRFLDRDELFAQIVAKPTAEAFAVELKTLRRWRSPESLLLPIGEEIARFLCGGDFEYVKSCEGSTCTLLFVDRTRGRARRWCSMAVCGNRAKVAAHRARAVHGRMALGQSRAIDREPPRPAGGPPPTPPDSGGRVRLPPCTQGGSRGVPGQDAVRNPTQKRSRRDAK